MSLGFVPGRGPLRRAHPYTPLTLGAAAAILAFALPAPVGPAALAAALAVFAVIEGVPVLAPAVLTSLPVWLLLFVLHGVLGSAPAVALVFGVRIFAVLLGFLLAIATVHPGRLVDALAESGVPFSFAFLLTATLQAVPRLRNRAVEILSAQRARGLRVRGSLLRRARAVVPLVIPLVLSALSEVDDRTIALEARGMSGVARRTPLHPPVNHLVDRLVRWGLVIATVAGVVARFVR